MEAILRQNIVQTGFESSEKSLPRRLPAQRGGTRVHQKAKHCNPAAKRDERRRKTEAERQEAEGGEPRREKRPGAMEREGGVRQVSVSA